MVLEDRSFNEITDLIKFYTSVGLPKNLTGLGMDNPTEEEILKIVSKMCQPGSYAHNMPFKVTEKMLRDAIIMTDRIGNKI